MIRVLAAAAHPDDIEFGMAGTLLLLRARGAQIHMWNLADGSCGSETATGPRTAAIRWKEARASAQLAGALLHRPIGQDLQLFFDSEHLAKAAAVLRRAKPNILLVPSPEDYMEDHQNAARLAVTAAFVRGMRNFRTRPPAPPWKGELAVYHAQPHMNRDSLGRRIRPSLFVNVASVWGAKKAMLACHKSQKAWLDASQGMGSYLGAQEDMAREVGTMSKKFKLAEGWRRHNNLGFCAPGYDPLRALLGNLLKTA